MLQLFIPIAFSAIILNGCAESASSVDPRTTTGESAGALVGGVTGDPEDSVEERAAEQELIIQRQRKELERQRREIEDLRRQRHYNEQLKRFE